MLSLALVTKESPLAMKVEEQLLEIHISLVHEVVITRLHRARGSLLWSHGPAASVR